MKHPKSVLITTGATVTFKKLISLILNPKIISQLITSGYTKLYVQYGNEAGVSEKFFKSQLENTILKQKLISKSKDLELETYVFEAFELIGFPFSTRLTQLMANCDLIISHAGTGSILDSLRLNKRLLVVINNDLMDNHQKEIADELIKDDYLVACDCDLDSIGTGLKMVETSLLSPFPEGKGDVLSTIIQQELK